jgi:hypothetical protein
MVGIEPKLHEEDPVARALAGAIRSGDLGSLRRLLAEHPGLASARIARREGGTSTPLHVVTDWPGFAPNGPAVVAALVEAGADPNSRFEGGRHTETPLHWAASSDDVEVLDALIDAGADVEAPGASIAGGPPLDDAIGYGQWHAARRLVDRGARVDKLWHAAALGMTARVEELLVATPPPPPDEVSEAFWQACHGGQRRTAERLLAHGADVNWIPPYTEATPLEIAASLSTRRQALVVWLRERGARAAGDPG